MYNKLNIHFWARILHVFKQSCESLDSLGVETETIKYLITLSVCLSTRLPIRQPNCWARMLRSILL